MRDTKETQNLIFGAIILGAIIFFIFELISIASGTNAFIWIILGIALSMVVFPVLFMLGHLLLKLERKGDEILGNDRVESLKIVCGAGFLIFIFISTLFGF